MQLYATYATICNYMTILYATICKYATICNYLQLYAKMQLMQLYAKMQLMQLYATYRQTCANINEL